jgi:hypothetical protein
VYNQGDDLATDLARQAGRPEYRPNAASILAIGCLALLGSIGAMKVTERIES